MELTVERLSKQYHNKIAVDRVSLKMRAGVYGLLGANGAGKTTLMRMICGILTPTSGEVKISGENNMDMGENFRNMLGYLPQDFGYYPNFTAQEFLWYMASLKGLMPGYGKEKTKELLEEVGLSKQAKKKIKTFSGGMKQRLGIAQALLNDPSILILDEPTAGLDPKERIRFRNMLTNLGKDKIILLSTHIVSDVESIADYIFIMKNGQICLEGTIDDLEKQTSNRVWKVVRNSHLVDEIQAEYVVSHLHKQEEGMCFRIISDKKPFPDAVSCTGNLEDLYLYYFSEEVEK